MAESRPQKIQRLRKERNRRRKLRSNLLNRAEQHARRIKILNAAIGRLTSPAVPGAIGGWHPKAIRNQVQSGGTWAITTPPRGVLHTTEGTSLPGYSGSHPHFTLDFKRGLLYQHVPITRSAYALRNLSGGVETNRTSNCIQIELVGFARESQSWSDEHYKRIADLMRFIEKNAGVKRQSSVKFVAGLNHLSASAWYAYAGWLGHQHVPENDHWDPGLFKINEALK